MKTLFLLFTMVFCKCDASQFQIDTFKIDTFMIENETCSKKSENVYTYDGTDITLLIGEPSSKGLPVTFKWKNCEETLTAPLEKSPPKEGIQAIEFLDNVKYTPQKSLDEFLNELNKRDYHTFQKMAWDNQGNINDMEWCPTLVFSRILPLHFTTWKIEHDLRNHKSIIYVLSENMPPLSVYTFAHQPSKPQPVRNVYSINKDGKISTVSRITWSSIPAELEKWAKQNNIIIPSSYTTVETSQPIAETTGNMIPIHNAFFKVAQKKPLKSKYIYCAGDAFYLAKEEEWNCEKITFDMNNQITDSGKKENLTSLTKTFCRLTSPDDTTKDTEFGNFQKGFYEPIDRDSYHAKIKHTWKRKGTNSTVSTFASRGGAFSIIDLNDILSSENFHAEIFKETVNNTCVFFENPIFKLDLKNKKKPEQIRITNLLLEIIELLPGDIFTRDGICFEGATFTKDILKYFIKNSSLKGKEIAINTIRMCFNRGLFFDNFRNLPFLCPKIIDLTGSNLQFKNYLLWDHIQKNNRLEQIILQSTKEDSPEEFLNTFVKTLVTHKKLEKIGYWGSGFSITDKGIKNLSNKEKLLFISKLIRVKELNLAGLDVEDGRAVVQCLANNASDLESLDFSEASNFSRIGDRFVQLFPRFSNLKEINLLETGITNGQTVELAAKMAESTSLQEVKLAMPYWVTNAFEIGKDMKNAASKINSPPSFVSNTFLIGTMGLFAPIVVIADIFWGGSHGGDYEKTLVALAEIKPLTNLTLELWGLRTNPEWTRNKFNELRRENKLREVKVIFTT